MAKGEVRFGDVGTVFELTFKDQNDNIVPINQATTKKFYFKKPTGTVVEKSGVFSTDGLDGKLRYVTVANDLDTLGDWEYQGYVVLPSGSWKTDLHAFRVHRNL